jgi:hypothetical protein
MKKAFSMVFLFIFMISLLSVCKKDNGNAPELPPKGSLVIDFSNFESGKKSSAESLDLKGVNNINWEFSVLVSGYWKSIIATTLAVPITSFNMAADNSPVFLGNKTWQWSYNASISINQVTVIYKARLTGQMMETEVNWKMYISKEGTGAFPEFIWFEGTSKLDGTGGKWILNHSSQYPEPLLQIDWKKNGSSLVSVKYTYVRTLNNNRVTDTFKDSFIEYGVTEGALNAYYSIHYYTGLSFSDVNIEWNTTSHNGRVKSLTYFGDSNWHCWDSSFLNVSCQ